MDIVLQLWGGLFYLTNKAMFALSEREFAAKKRLFKMVAWSAYLIGVPAWVVILTAKQNWIAASVEAGGIPAMLLGLYNTYKNNQSSPHHLNVIVSFFTYASLTFGLLFSFYDHGGLHSITQILEIGVMVGFLMGGFLMAKNNPKGWLFFMLMNISMAALMFLQGKTILMAQQLTSLCFVIYGFRTSMALSKG